MTAELQSRYQEPSGRGGIRARLAVGKAGAKVLREEEAPHRPFLSGNLVYRKCCSLLCLVPARQSPSHTVVPRAPCWNLFSFLFLTHLFNILSPAPSGLFQSPAVALLISPATSPLPSVIHVFTRSRPHGSVNQRIPGRKFPSII